MNPQVVKRNSRARASLFGITILWWIAAIPNVAWSQDKIRIATWNIEHLGSPGRGLGGIGAGSLQRRSDNDLKKVADFIKDDLRADVLAIQEVAITATPSFGNVSETLDKIVDELGSDWSAHVGSPGSGIVAFGTLRNLQNAFLWNTAKVRLVMAFDMRFPNEIVGSKNLFDRVPLAGYFQALKNLQDTNDFLLVNVHLTSGQGNDENHLAAMVIIEQNIRNELKRHNFRESDRIILGDFNDNPFAVDSNGQPEHIDLMYRYMESRRYTDLVTLQTGFTRMDTNRRSIIDHILVNKGASVDLLSSSAERVMPSDTTDAGLATWRRTFSDHFPLFIELKVRNSDNDVD